MKTNDNKVSKEKVLQLLKKSKRPLTFLQIAGRLGLDKKERKSLKKLLRRLKRKGEVFAEKGRYLPADEVFVTGKVIPYPAGFGFLEIEGREKDIYIPHFEMEKVTAGDLVRARITKFRGKKEVRIEKVLRRGTKEVIGKLEIKDDHCLIIPLDQNTHLTFEVPSKDCEKIKEGTVIVAKVTRYPSPGILPRAKIKEVVGDPQKKFLAIEILIRKHRLPTDYPQDVLTEAQRIPSSISRKEADRRRDLRDQVCFTIDPEKARDFDDAVAIEQERENFRLFVHIADVSHFVRPGTALDSEAFRRGFTFYLPDRALHMLPERLSADLCSLRPGEERLAFTCEMVFDSNGDLKHYDLYESIIVSKARLTYGEALSIIVGDPTLEKKYPQLVKPLRMMEDLYRILSKRRWEKGSIDFDLPEAEVIVDEMGEPAAVVPYERHVAHRIIEQFMISANETVAFHLENAGYPCLYRVHEPPDEERVENLLEILAGLGYRVRKPRQFTPKFFQKIIEDFEGRKEEHLVRFLTLRAMSRAKYSPNNLGHFGLASDHYAHFTSPIRRYPDIIVHRLLKMSLRGEPPPEGIELYLEEAGEHLSKQERLADEVEWEAIDIMKARYMRSRIGEEFDGVITGVTSFGLFVEIEQILVEGLVSISSLIGDEFVYDEPAHRLVGVKTGKVFRLGDKVRVRVVSVDEERGKVELELTES